MANQFFTLFNAYHQKVDHSDNHAALAGLYYNILMLWNSTGRRNTITLHAAVFLNQSGFKSHKTYKKYLDILVKSGLITVVNPYKNQYAPLIISLGQSVQQPDQPGQEGDTTTASPTPQPFTTSEEVTPEFTLELSYSAAVEVEKFLNEQKIFLSYTHKRTLTEVFGLIKQAEGLDNIKDKKVYEVFVELWGHRSKWYKQNKPKDINTLKHQFSEHYANVLKARDNKKQRIEAKSYLST